MSSHSDTLDPAAVTRGRLLIVVASVLWSLSGAFTCFLREPTFLGLDTPTVYPLQIAAGRVFFASLVLTTFLRPKDITFRPSLLLNGIVFAVMNATFVSAMALGKKATAILLQYTAPLWLFLVGVFILGERADRRGLIALLIGMLGIGIIICGDWEGENILVVLLGLASGITFAGVLLGLRLQRDVSAVWLNVSNHFLGALMLFPFLLWYHMPTVPQLGWLVLFGGLQMGLPYLLMTRGLKYVTPQEAGTLSLLEPVLNPVWAFLVMPDKEKPTIYILLGGICILGALAYRYWPVRRTLIEPKTT